ncbi:MAG: nitrous oxide reductase accessory protein NosL [Sulfurimonas sp.]|uniref:nitrous oxide reductase accessory protein NosL n=1 Tax=Sulfurimonas sp. TaxID=2022749 RepID=UPI0025FC46AD|nr:nitrous oxide reductase accessory protein NosL [Sulfurimonas sp.]MCK9490982.1 nitrous oxide reductase accessory protein NosL [Sulfurimonas sp.]
MIKIFIAVVLLSSVLFSYEMDYTKDTEGLVKGMKVHKAPNWVAKIELTNGKKVFFVSPKAMIEFYHHPGKWFDVGVKSEDDMKDVIVTDFTTLKPINARGAFYVYGSNMVSPIGDDLPAFATYDAAADYSKKHNGKRILNFKEIPEALIKLLNGRI